MADYGLLSDFSSDLSSVPSSPPMPYLSPASSQEPDNATLLIHHAKRSLGDADIPPARKRRRVEPKPRTTEKLDLTDPETMYTAESKAQLDRLLKVLRKRRKIVVIAGAGISVAAGSECYSMCQ